MSVVAVMQPTYLPWMGYFAMMDRADVFVFLDNVQFSRRSWQQRNCIKSADGVQMLTVPVVKKGLRSQLICDTKIDLTQRFAEKHKHAIKRAYAKAPFFSMYSVELMNTLDQKEILLADYNIRLIGWLRTQFEIECRLIRSSELGIEGRKEKLLCHICQELDCDVYLSAVGSNRYLGDAEAFREAGIAVNYNVFDHPEYQQLHGEFQPYMSAIDLLLNVGDRSIELIRQGYRI